MNGYLLDTNICIFAFRDAYGINERMKQYGKKQCYVSDITIMELRYGAYKSTKTAENLAIIDNFLKKVKIVHFVKAIDVFCKEKLRLQRMGTPLEDYDLLIGCAAKAQGLTMITHNVKHFERIEGLVVEDWVSQ